MRIQDINSSGEGVGRIQEKAVFVPGAIIGEEVEVVIDQSEKSFDRGHISQVLSPSPHRVDPLCPSFLDCGGCDFLHMDYEEQLLCKQGIVCSALSRIAKLELEVASILAAPAQFHYRNKASFPVSPSGAGYFRKNSHDIVSISSCALVDERCLAVFFALRSWAISASVRHIVVRVCNGEVMVTIVTDQQPFAQKKQLLSLLEPLDVASVYLNYNTTPAILGDHSDHIWGKPQLTQTVLGNAFPVSPTSFLQVNPALTQRLYQQALASFDLTNKRVFDGYCGIGTLSLALAQRARQVVGVELVSSAIADARSAAAINGCPNVTFVQDRVEHYLPQAAPFDIAFLDPPRSGLHQRVIQTIAQQQIPQIVYISCSPQTLARDLARFFALGYRTVRLTPVDMFPNTAHVECVAVLHKG